MLMKLLVLFGLIGGALLAMRLFSKANTIRAERREGDIRRRADSQDLISCTSCGAYHLKGSPCDCKSNPTP